MSAKANAKAMKFSKSVSNGQANFIEPKNTVHHLETVGDTSFYSTQLDTLFFF